MRILGVEPGPFYSVADCHRGWMRAFQAAGQDVASVNLGARLDFYAGAHLKRGRRWVTAFPFEEAVRLASKGIVAAAFEFQPDVMWFTSGFFVPLDVLDLLRARGIRVVLLHTESPYEDDVQVGRAAHADVNLINDPTGIDKYPAGTLYQWHCYDPAVHHPAPPIDEYRSDVCFVGTGYPSRVEFLEQVDWDGIDVALAGHWKNLDPDSPLRKFVSHDINQCLDNDQAIKFYVSAQASFNLYRVEAQRPELSAGWSMGPREVELAACGVPFLRQQRGEGDDVLPMLPTFDGPDDFAAQLRELLADDQRRRSMADEARAAVADRTFDNAAARLLSLL